MRNWKLNITLPCLFMVVHHASGLSDMDPLVDSKVGFIRGLRATDGDYSMYLGIPYATLNESNPFGASAPHPRFTEVFEAFNDSAICPQVEEFNNTIVGSLDCLHVNIYVPDSANSRNLLPVLVYIYGGLFMIGFSGRYLYGPRYLIKHDIILVTFNYRLGPYGFMCLNTPEVPGNQGLKDQQLALRWIKNNIEAFQGDPNKVTICGSSSGASAADFHLIYSNEQLFHQVIMQSGTALHPWAMLQPDPAAPLKLSKQLGFTATNTHEALKFLSTIDSNLLTKATSELGLKFRPCVEKDFGNVEKFVYDYPVNIQKPSLGNVPILLGCNSDEALAAYDNLTPQEFANMSLFYDNIEEYFDFDVEELKDMEDYAKSFYIGDEKLSREVKQGIIKLNSDFYFNYPVVRTIQKYLDNGIKNIYYYFFAYSGKRNFLKGRLNVTAKGASHADELGYLFDISYMDKNLTPEDELIIHRITTLWANFVKFGDPTPETTELLPVKWPIVTKDNMNYLTIDTKLQLKKRIFRARMTFWDLLYRLNRKAQVGYVEDADQNTCVAIPNNYKEYFGNY